MNTRQLEDAYLQEVERISQKVHLGEIPHDAGEFLIMLAREKTVKSTKRLKRPSRLIFYVMAAMISVAFIYSFFQLYSLLNRNDLSLIFLYLIGLLTIVFVALFQVEVNRVERMFSRFFSKAYFKKILHSPEIEFEWKKEPIIQIRLMLKNEDNLFAGIRDEEVCELKSNIISTVTRVMDDGKSYIEEVSDHRVVINFMVHEGVNCSYVMRQLVKLIEELKLMDGEWFSKSVRIGASMVLGEFLVGNMGYDYQVFRTAGRKVGISESLVQAAGWNEIFIDEVTLCELDSEIHAVSCEPIFVRTTGDLIKVHKFSGWKESIRGI